MNATTTIMDSHSDWLSSSESQVDVPFPSLHEKIGACQQLAAEYDQLRHEIESLRRRQQSVLWRLTEANGQLARELGADGPARLLCPRTSSAEVLAALMALSNHRYASWTEFVGPQRHTNAIQQLTELLLAGGTADEVARQVLKNRGLDALRFDRPSLTNLRASILSTLRQLTRTGYVIEADNHQIGSTVWVLRLHPGADLLQEGAAGVVSLQAKAVQELYDREELAEHRRHLALMRERAQKDAEARGRGWNRTLADTAAPEGLPRNDLLGSVLKPRQPGSKDESSLGRSLESLSRKS